MTREKSPCIYIMTNKHNTVLYTGVTSNLSARLNQHQGNPGFGFTGKYNAKKLVHVESFEDMDQALRREKQIKGGSRQKKLDLINHNNPEWRDLSEDYLE